MDRSEEGKMQGKVRVQGFKDNRALLVVLKKFL
jgi:hypothetical protein